MVPATETTAVMRPDSWHASVYVIAAPADTPVT